MQAVGREELRQSLQIFDNGLVALAVRALEVRISDVLVGAAHIKLNLARKDRSQGGGEGGSRRLVAHRSAKLQILNHLVQLLIVPFAEVHRAGIGEMLGIVVIAVNEGLALEGLFPLEHHAVSRREVNALEVVSFPLGRFHIDRGIVVHVNGAVDRGTEDKSLRILDHLVLGSPHRVGVGNEDDLRLVKPLFGKSFFQTVEHLNVEIGGMVRRAKRALAMSVYGVAEPNVQEIDIGLFLCVINEPFHLDVHHSLVAHAELREEGRACVKASFALNQRHGLVHFLRRFVGLAGNAVINAPGRGNIAVAERVELESRSFKILFKELDQSLAAVVANVLVGEETVALVAIPAAHIVVGNDVLHHKEVHVNLGRENDGRADVLVIGRSL